MCIALIISQYKQQKLILTHQHALLKNVKMGLYPVATLQTMPSNEVEESEACYNFMDAYFISFLRRCFAATSVMATSV